MKTVNKGSQIAVFIAANTKDATQNQNDYSSHSVITEYFTEEEIEDIVSAFRSSSIFVDISFEETDFIQKLLAEQHKQIGKEYVAVYTSAQKGTGPGRKSLIPSFCNMLNIPIMGSNAYVRSLCRHKYHASSILKLHNIQSMDAWLYDFRFGWLLNQSPPKNEKIILKPVHESASIGIDRNSITMFNHNLEGEIRKLSESFQQPIIIQPFISGYEVEIPIVCSDGVCYALGAAGIAINDSYLLGDQILTYDIVYNDQYKFYDFSTMFDPKVVNSIKACAEKCGQILGIEGLGRIDFRITTNGNFVVTDISTNPHIVKHSSYGYVFKNLGFEYSELPLSMLALLSMKQNWY